MRYILSLTMNFLIVAVICLSGVSANNASPSAEPDVIWRKFDEFSKLSFQKQKQRLGNFILQLQAERGAVAYVVSYAGRVSCPHEAQTRAARLRSYLISAGRLDPNRIKTIDAGYNEDWVIELWIAPELAPPLTKELVRGGFLHLSADQVNVAAKCNHTRRGSNLKRRRA
jgi:hypothetical protein